ncbi:MAG TPA: ribonucleotide-diphosphate reductase subunit beta [Solirubrobacterales bacterium]|nr:ribonucleotide-diphosphate reductase subunit beta [Solirubrobacterales bacterium]
MPRDRSGVDSGGTVEAALGRMAGEDPELAARLIVQSLPAAAAPLSPDLTWRLDVDGLGSWRVTGGGDGGAATVAVANGAGDEDFALATDADGLARLAAGASPLGLVLRRRIRLSGRRRKAGALRGLDAAAGPRELARFGVPVDPDLLFRSLAYAIDPEWTRGHRFAVAYELLGDGGGRWVVEVDDGAVRVHPGQNGVPVKAGSTVRMSVDTWRRVLGGELPPAAAMMSGLTRALGELYPVTLMGRWLDRSAGLDGPEVEREARQREVQERRVGTWGSASGGVARPIDPAQGGAAARRDNLMTYEELYALWEKRNWRAHELDFSVDREQWLTAPTEAQQHTLWSMASFYVGEERVAADLAPFVLAAPTGEAEIFLATQLVDEARHAVFFDRYVAEVMAVDGDDMRSRLAEAEAPMLDAWHFLFDDSLRGVASRLAERPDDLELFVEGIVTYHMVTEGVLAMTGQRSILSYMDRHSIYPGFQTGFSLVEQDEHRHIAFGVRFLRDVVRERPEMRQVILATLDRLLPEAARVFSPPEVSDPTEFISYDYSSQQIYGFAYTALKRRMDVIGVEIPPPEQLMPGPIDAAGFDDVLTRPIDVPA